MHRTILLSLALVVGGCAPVGDQPDGGRTSATAWRPCDAQALCATDERCVAVHGLTARFCMPSCGTDESCPMMEGVHTNCFEGFCEAPCGAANPWVCAAPTACRPYTLVDHPSGNTEALGLCAYTTP